MNTEAIFAALPHVNQIWLTKDGNFHLHPNKGGELVERGAVVKEKQVNKPGKNKE